MTAADRITRIIDFFYVKPIRRIVPLQTFRYAVCGAVNMIIDLSFYYLLYYYVVGERYVDLGFVVMSPHIQALFLVFPITFFNGFWLNRNVTFRQSPLKGHTQLLRYMLSVAGSLLINYVCMKLFVEQLNVPPTLSKALTTCVTVVYSFLMQKYFTFRGSAA